MSEGIFSYSRAPCHCYEKAVGATCGRPPMDGFANRTGDQRSPLRVLSFMVVRARVSIVMKALYMLRRGRRPRRPAVRTIETAYRRDVQRPSPTGAFTLCHCEERSDVAIFPLRSPRRFAPRDDSGTIGTISDSIQSGLALSLCPALCLCKGKCLPSRCGRLTPPLAALPCGPPPLRGAPC